MKTKLTQRLLATFAVAMFFVGGVMAQIPADYSETQTEINYQTAGKDFRLYVAPDPIYSPNYVGSGTLNADARWTWTYTGLTGNPATATATIQNWIDFTSPVEGNYSVVTVESNATTSCVDGIGTTQVVEVVAAPTAVMGGGSIGAAGYTWTTLAGPIYRSCASATPGTETVTVNITEDADLPEALRGYAFTVTEVVGNVTAADLTVADGAPATNATFVDYPLSSKLKTGNVNVTATHTFDVATGEFTFPTSSLVVTNSKPTRYEYVLTGVSDGPTTTGIVSAISQKSDYDAATATTTVVEHAFGTAVKVTYLVLPLPNTGDIYHISNTYAY